MYRGWIAQSLARQRRRKHPQPPRNSMTAPAAGQRANVSCRACGADRLRSGTQAGPQVTPGSITSIYTERSIFHAGRKYYW
jgi:hypothetical protein